MSDSTAPIMTPPVAPVSKSPAWRANAVSAASIKPVAIRWLWPGWLAKGKLHILAGAGGTGKTTLLIGLIATLTSAGRWPDGERCPEAGNVIIWSSEDDPADTIVPRLAAAGANLHRVHILQGRIGPHGEIEPFDPATDIDLLTEAAREIGGVSLLMLDPIVSAIKGDMHKANDVRRALQCVVDFAEANRCAVVGISHFAKGTAGGSPAERVVGSQAFSALARTVLVAAKQEDSDLRVLARAKSNISVDEGGVSYTIEPATLESEHGPIETTRVLWGDKIEGTARDILGDVEESGEQEDHDQDDPSDCLYRILKDNPLESNEAKVLMKRNGYTEKQIRRAREKLSVVVARTGNKKDVKSYWSLPQNEAETLLVPSKPYSCPSLGVGTSGKNGHESEKGARVEGDEDRQYSPIPTSEGLEFLNVLPGEREVLDADEEDVR